MRNIILIALLFVLATFAGCKSKEPQPTENTMGSTEQTQPKQKAMSSAESTEETASAAEAPASEDGSGTAQ